MKFREKLETWGVGLAMAAVAISLLNCFALPFARQLHGYILPLAAFGLIVFLVLYRIHVHHLNRISAEKMASMARRFVPVYIVGTAVLHLILGYYMEYVPLGDNLMLYQGSQYLAREGAFEKGSDFILYFCRFSNQWGFLLYLTAFYRILFTLGIHNTFYSLVVAETLLYCFAFLVLYRLAERVGGKRGNLILGFFLVFCFPMFLSACVLYTDTFSLPFVIFTLDMADRAVEAKEKSQRVLWALLCGCMALIGGQIKMTVIIVLIAAAILWALRMPKMDGILCAFLSFLLVVSGTSLIHTYVLDRYLDRAIYDQENTPIIHWVMMSIPSANNPYGNIPGDYNITWGMMDEGASHEEVMASIYSRMKDKIYTLRYPNRLILALLRKNSAYMGDGTFGMTEMLDDKPVRRNPLSEFVLEDGKYYPVYMGIESGIWFGLLALVAVRQYRELQDGKHRKSLFYISVLGVILFLMMWEARSRYLFNFVPVFMLCAIPVEREPADNMVYKEETLAE